MQFLFGIEQKNTHVKKKQTEVIGLIATVHKLSPSDENDLLMNEIAQIEF